MLEILSAAFQGLQSYSIEASTLQAQYHCLLSPRMAMQLITSRTVNILGHPGKNVSCDLHMEHLNKEAKNSITGFGSNITDVAVTRIGRSLGHTIKVVKCYDLVNGIKEPSSRRSQRSCEKDMEILLKQLLEQIKFFQP